MDFSLQQMAKSSEVQAHLLLSNCIMADLRSNKCSSITEFIRRGAVGDGQPLLRVDYDRSQPGPCQTAQRSERNKMAGGLEVHSILHSSQLSFCLVIVAMASSLTRLHSLTKCTTSPIVTGPQTSLPLLHHSHFTCSPLLTPPLPLLTSPTPSSPLTHTFLITLIPPHSHLPSSPLTPPSPSRPTPPYLTHTHLPPDPLIPPHPHLSPSFPYSQHRSTAYASVTGNGLPLHIKRLCRRNSLQWCLYCKKQSVQRRRASFRREAAKVCQTCSCKFQFPCQLQSGTPVHCFAGQN